MRHVLGIAAMLSAVSGASIVAQQPSPSTAPADSPRYDVVSIKRNVEIGAGGGMRSLPDGTLIMTNQPIRSILSGAASVPVRDVIGYPSWVTTERYDVTLKPPAGSTPEQRAQMRRTMFASAGGATGSGQTVRLLGAMRRNLRQRHDRRHNAAR